MVKILRRHFKKLKKVVAASFFISCVFVFSSFYGQDNSVASTKIIRCYPNPATSIINFDLQKNASDIILQIYSFSGKKMTELVVNGNRISVTLTDYYRGLYVYQLRDKDGKILQSGKFQVVK